jgi:putative PEP-CTERM system TPR-repeat lipoprotein
MKDTQTLQNFRLRVLPLLLGCALGFASASSFGQGNSQAAKFYEDALARYEKKDLPGAIIQLKNALQIDKNQLPVQLLLGKALMQSGEVAAAEVALSEALRLGVNRAEVVVLLGQAYVAQGKHRLVLEQNTFNPAGLSPDVQLQLYLLRASTHGDLGDVQSALRAIEQARAIDSGNADTWLSEVPIRIRTRQFKEANTAADRALAITPGSANASYQKGSILHVQGDLRGAMAAYDRVLQADASHVEARVARIGILIDQGRFADAGKDVVELRRISPREPRGAYLMALLAERNGKPVESAAALKEVTDLLDPVPIDFIRYRPQLLMLNGMAHFGLNQGEKAKLYLEAFQRVQNNSPVSKLLARIYLADGNAGLAVSLLEGYLRAQPRDGQALTLLASAHIAAGRPAKATALMQEALKTRDDPSFRTALGMSLVRGGQSADGILELEAAYKKDPRQTQAATALVQLYLRTGQSRKAIPVAERLVQAQVGNANFHNLLGMAQGQSGNVTLARASFDKALQLNPGLTLAKLNLARLEISTKALDAAGNRLNELLKLEPNNSEAMYELAIIADRKGQQGDAQRWLEKARDTAGGKELRWDLALVDFHLRYGRPGPAFDAAKTASAKAPEDLDTQMAYVRAQIANGDTVGAKSTLTGATRFAEYDPVRQVQIAGLQMAINNPAGAAYSLQKALSTRPDFLSAHAMLVEVELRQGEVAKAESRAKELALRYPSRAIGQSLLGDVAMAKNQPAAAVEPYRRAHQAEPGTGSLMRLFGALLVQDGGRPALQLAEQWLKGRPQDLTVRMALADGYARSGNFASAKQNYELANKISPDNGEVLNNLANVQMRLKDPAAVKTAEMALAKAPGNPLAIDTLGWALFQNGQSERALQLLRDARLRLPSNPEIRYHLAVVLAQLGRNGEAREELEIAVKSSQAFEGSIEAEKLLRSLR